MKVSTSIMIPLTGIDTDNRQPLGEHLLQLEEFA
jgi:hypothetical protein